MNEAEILTGRLNELSSRAEKRECHTYSEFLTLAEQSDAVSMRFTSSLSFEGGYEGAERRIAHFKGKDCVYDEEAPIVCVEIAPKAPKFAEVLSHRDFLGSLTGLGIRREVLGDIILDNNKGYVFCLETAAEIICRSLEKVRRTDVTCERASALPENLTTLPDTESVIIASERLDAVIAAVFRLSRTEAQKLFDEKKIFIDGKLVQNVSTSAQQGNIISVRGFGRFIYEGVSSKTRKERLYINVKIFK